MTSHHHNRAVLAASVTSASLSLKRAPYTRIQLSGNTGGGKSYMMVALMAFYLKTFDEQKNGWRAIFVLGSMSTAKSFIAGFIW